MRLILLTASLFTYRCCCRAAPLHHHVRNYEILTTLPGHDASVVGSFVLRLPWGDGLWV